MSSSTSPDSLSHTLNDIAKVEVEKPKKMSLMFCVPGQKHVVFLRPDGLRSRGTRGQRPVKEEKKEKVEVAPERDNITDLIDDVVAANCSSPTSEPLPTVSCSTQPRETNGNRSYHGRSKTYGTLTMTDHKNRWTYQTACDINAAEQSGDGEMYYIAHPFLPMPRSRRNGIPTVARMNYAAQRLENRKFRGQTKAVQEIQSNESVKCEKCGFVYFYESRRMMEHISYLQPANEEDLPIVVFDCPLCKETTRVDVA